MALPESKARRVLINREEAEANKELQAEYQNRIQRMFDVLEVPGYMVPDYVWGLLVNWEDPSLVVLLVEVVNADQESPLSCVQFYNSPLENGERKWKWVVVERPEEDLGISSPLTLWVEDPDSIRPPHMVNFHYQDEGLSIGFDGVGTSWDCIWPEVVDDMEDPEFQRQVLRATDSYEFDNEEDDLLTEEDS